MKRPFTITAFGAALVVLTIGAAPLLSSAADHIDASQFGSLGNSGGAFAPTSVHGERDINDVYAFQGANASRTVLVMTTNPAINAFGGKFGANVRYIINVDRTGDAVQDLAFVVRFDDGAAGHQKYTVTRYTGANAVSLGQGSLRGSGSTAGNGMSTLQGDGRVFAGVRSDPFFFDLTGFVGTLFHIGSDALGDHPSDFFSGLDTNAIVIEVPDDQLGGKIGVWGQTTWWNGSTWMPGDQMGRPAINTVFNNKIVDPNAATTKNLFNATRPSRQRTADGGQFRTNIIATLTNINAALGTGHPDYTNAQAQGLADFLLPDILTYDTATRAGGLNGRALSDDVIDIELGITTNGAVASDGVGPHGDYQGSFPYLGNPHP
ncbi:MAG TPA: DUF4331 family protein [Candidatus Limnocylindrales bacterium]|nr:DUF4331 family protein [Candidatus Limnocylindrales bacterium]